MLPFFLRPSPAQGQDAIQFLTPTGGVVASHGEVGQKGHIKVKRATREIRENGRHVPHERGVEVRPQEALIRIGKHPEETPCAAQVNQGIHAGDHQGEGGHHLRTTGDRATVFSVEYTQNRGHERPRVADTNPEHKVGDVETPVYRASDTGHTHAPPNLESPGDKQPHKAQQSQDGNRNHISRRDALDSLQQHPVHLPSRPGIDEEEFCAEFFLSPRQDDVFPFFHGHLVIRLHGHRLP